MDDLVNAICGIDCKPRQDACNGYCVGKADHPPLIQRQDVMTPECSNADEWLLFITEHSPEFVAVQIAERLDEITALRARLAEVEQERDDALTEAVYLAKTLHGRFYQAQAPQWEPLDDVAGVISQIDNMTAGIADRAERAEAEAATARRDAVKIKSDAINDFCAKAGIAMSVEVKAIPEDVREFRRESAFRALRDAKP